MLICDTSGLLAFLDARELDHHVVVEAVRGDDGPFVISPFVLAELDYLLATCHGPQAQLSSLRELAGGSWDLASFGREDVRQACEILDTYRDQSIGLADASLVVLAARHGTARLLTLDRRHFRVVRTLGGRPFELLPE